MVRTLPATMARAPTIISSSDMGTIVVAEVVCAVMSKPKIRMENFNHAGFTERVILASTNGTPEKTDWRKLVNCGTYRVPTCRAAQPAAPRQRFSLRQLLLDDQTFCTAGACLPTGRG